MRGLGQLQQVEQKAKKKDDRGSHIACVTWWMARRSSWRKGPYNDTAVSLPQPRPQGLDNDNHGVWGDSESEEEDIECPLCLEPMDETDQTFFPCPCGYQLCLYCFNRVKDKNDKCPACRTKYNPDAYTYGTCNLDEDEDEGDGG